MKLIVNGESMDVDTATTAHALIVHLGLTGRRIAMELNGDILPRSTHASHRFTDGDRVEIVHAVGGG
ncbi:MAG: sulfur carrier protein ThiS [Pseudomonadota bacterium]